MSHRLLYPKEEDHDSVYRLCLKKKKASKVSCAEYQSGQTLFNVAYKDDKNLCFKAQKLNEGLVNTLCAVS